MIYPWDHMGLALWLLLLWPVLPLGAGAIVYGFVRLIQRAAEEKQVSRQSSMNASVRPNLQYSQHSPALRRTNSRIDSSTAQ
ncbi:MAG: hypothetical protein HYU27_10785 [Acidobacteria bacterium]|nr:hypothetical protein [Acidobacteriota bacterium]